MALVEGAAAKALGELYRERWTLATGAELPAAPAEKPRHDSPYWPTFVTADLADIFLGIARTLPRFRTQRRVREIYQLTRDLIRNSRRYLYIENQYLTARSVRKELIRSLKQKTGPEIIIILPRHPFGWMEGRTIFTVQQTVIEALYQADTYKRLKVYYPQVHPDEKDFLYVHTKLMIVDDTYLKIGSSNLNNRSMGFDTECDIVFHAQNEGDCRAIRKIRNRFIAEHISQRPESLDQKEVYFSSIIDVIESRSHFERSLQKMVPDKAWKAFFSYRDPFFDRQRPIRFLWTGLSEIYWLRLPVRFINYLRQILFLSNRVESEPEDHDDDVSNAP
jgi:phosphatidylserine/phosphatidylglycerophosphate/cardiolipin synthase-like enzyme